MADPMAPSSHYRALGWKPVYQWGLVLWMHPRNYAVIRASDLSCDVIDATDEQIEAQDRWYEQAEAERKQEHELLMQMFQRPDVQRSTDG